MSAWLTNECVSGRHICVELDLLQNVIWCPLISDQ